MNKSLVALQNWYASNCDETWEHHYGVKIESLDNPGWRMEINLVGTALVDKEYTTLAREVTETDWIHSCVRDGSFHGAGGAHNLVELIDIFLKWAS